MTRLCHLASFSVRLVASSVASLAAYRSTGSRGEDDPSIKLEWVRVVSNHNSHFCKETRIRCTSADSLACL